MGTTTSDGAVVRTEGLTKRYGSGNSSRVALDSVDLAVAPGEFIAVVGPSGSGKTTLLQLLAAMDTPTEGEVWIDGRHVRSLTEPERTEIRRSAVGFVFQDFDLIPILRAWENVALPMLLARRPVSERRIRARELLAVVGLDDRADALPSELSGGEQQRVALARALVNDPKVLLADEPTGSLDTQSGLDVMALFDRLRRDRHCAIVAVTHDLRMASSSDRLVRLRDGAVVDGHESDSRPLDGPESSINELA